MTELTNPIAGVTEEGAKFILEVLTRECRDLLDNLADRGVLKFNEDGDQFTPEMFNQVIRDHFAMDNSGYGITVEEWLPHIDEATRIKIVNEVLAKPEYTS